MRISDWSSDVCSSDLVDVALQRAVFPVQGAYRASIEVVLEKQHLIAQNAEHRVDAFLRRFHPLDQRSVFGAGAVEFFGAGGFQAGVAVLLEFAFPFPEQRVGHVFDRFDAGADVTRTRYAGFRSEEHTSELQSLMR